MEPAVEARKNGTSMMPASRNPSPPCAKEQNGNEDAEDHLRGDGKNVVRGLQAHQGNQRQDEHGDLESARELTAPGPL